MQSINIKGTPANACNYQLDDGRIFRIYTKVLTPEAEIPTAQMLTVQTNGYEITKDGSFLVDDNGEPVMLDKRTTQISLENVRNGVDTMNGGWVPQDLAYDPENPREDVKDVKQLKAVPKTGAPGDRVYAKDSKQTYVYSAGQYENIRRARLSEAVAMAPKAEAEPLDVSEILPK